MYPLGKYFLGYPSQFFCNTIVIVLWQASNAIELLCGMVVIVGLFSFPFIDLATS